MATVFANAVLKPKSVPVLCCSESFMASISLTAKAKIFTLANTTPRLHLDIFFPYGPAPATLASSLFPDIIRMLWPQGLCTYCSPAGSHVVCLFFYFQSLLLSASHQGLFWLPYLKLNFPWPPPSPSCSTRYHSPRCLIRDWYIILHQISILSANVLGFQNIRESICNTLAFTYFNLYYFSLLLE